MKVWSPESHLGTLGDRPVIEAGKVRVARVYRAPPMCDGCRVNRADPPSKLCPGCQAYRDHQQ